MDRFETMCDFYERILGLTPVSKRPDHVAFQHGGFRLTLGVHSEVRGPAKDPLRAMINFAVADIEKTYLDLTDDGAVAIRAPELEPWGGWIATFSDPDGNTIQLLQLPIDRP